MKQVFLRNTNFYIDSERQNKVELRNELDDIINEVIAGAIEVGINENTDLHEKDIAMPVYNGVQKIMDKVSGVDKEDMEKFAYEIQRIIMCILGLRQQGHVFKPQHINFFYALEEEEEFLPSPVPSLGDSNYTQWLIERRVYFKFITDEILEKCVCD